MSTPLSIEQMTIREASRLLSEKQVSSVELTQAVLESIRQKDGEIQAYLTVDEEKSLARAREADEARANGSCGDLLGVPVAVKDLINVKGDPSPVPPKSFPATPRFTMRPSSRIFARMARFSPGAPTWMSSRWVPPRNTPPTKSRKIQRTSRAFLEVPAAVPPPQSREARRSPRSERTPAGRFANPQRSADVSA